MCGRTSRSVRRCGAPASCTGLILTQSLSTNYHFPVTLSVVIITFNEEANLPRTLESVKWADEIIVVDSGSTDRTVEIAKSYNAKVWVEPWKGFAAQKNSALEKASCDWILSLDADEEVSLELGRQIAEVLEGWKMYRKYCNQPDCGANRDQWRDDLTASLGVQFDDAFAGCMVRRKNMFLRRWIRHGGFWPDSKLRFFLRGRASFENRAVHEDAKASGTIGLLKDGALLHHAYPTLSSYIEHMNRYSSLGAEMAASKGKRGFSFINIVLRPIFTFIYNYFFRLGFLDGREGLLLHLYHSVYVSWKYAKLWEITRKPS
jgi:glycosyltransferase involved in cell wall biosynthesis